jgi:DNA invertase Pin-like site-specific DNA recombinase
MPPPFSLYQISLFEQLRRVLDQLDKGDALTLIRLDRLTGSTCDLLNTLATIATKGAGFRLLYDTRSDTTTAHGRLMLKRKTAGWDDNFLASLAAA